MSERSDGEVAVAWIANSANFWAWEELDRACAEDPEKAWRIILRIADGTDSEQIIANLGAGPLEDLLSKNGASFIDRIEAMARSNPRFRECLFHTWQNTMTTDVWTRVCLATNRDPSNQYGHGPRAV